MEETQGDKDLNMEVLVTGGDQMDVDKMQEDAAERMEL